MGKSAVCGSTKKVAITQLFQNQKELKKKKKMAVTELVTEQRENPACYHFMGKFSLPSRQTVRELYGAEPGYKARPVSGGTVLLCQAIAVTEQQDQVSGCQIPSYL